MTKVNGSNTQPDEITRIKPIGWFHYAASYAISARYLTINKVETTHPDAPIRHLYRHSIELYLKAYLLHSGVDVKTLKDKYGHNIEKLAVTAKVLGLKMSDEQLDQIAFCNDPLPDRYLETGSRRVLNEGALLAICRHLHTSISPLIYESEGISRQPPRL